jgi:hypothetical protein
MAPDRKEPVDSRPIPFWGYTMLTSDAKLANAFIRGARESGLPFSVFAVWYAIIAHLERDTGILTCTQRQPLARTAEMAVGDVHRAIDKLVATGVLLREERGRCRVHPSVMWRGELARRGRAEEDTPKLTLVDGGRMD